MNNYTNNICVSIILPIYNAQKYLTRCLGSILSQTMSQDNIEVILVNDGSSDLSVSICNEYAYIYDNFRVVHKNNGGAASARNAGLQIAKGEYVAFVDPDDYIDPAYCELPYNEALRTNADIVIFDADKEYPEDNAKEQFKSLCHADYPFVTDNTDDIQSMRCQILYPYMNAKGGNSSFYKNIPLAAPWDKLYKRSFLISNSLEFPEELEVLDDMSFNFMAFGKAKVVSYIHMPLYHYQVWNSSITNSYRPDRPMQDQKVFRFLISKINEEEVSKNISSSHSLLQAYYARVIKSFAICCRLCFYNKSNPLDKNYKRQMIIKLMGQEPYFIAFKNVNMAKLEWKLKAVAIAGKMKSEWLLCVLNKLQNG